MTKSIIDIIGFEEATQLMASAIHDAVECRGKLGLPKAVNVDGVVYRQYPDGSLEQVEVINGSLARPFESPVTRP
ncbi:hypothetical protein [Ottowia sp.]|jgi:hypothetical protein|uniref:hypothetical protein n=1 Tax=Ottowia sp. TaxID=1898956 RepID=UPI0025FA9495|nr:hypothetical protein [Ottowia sp.]MBK6612614.1 hypothetical protein [Ottowia sp.]